MGRGLAAAGLIVSGAVAKFLLAALALVAMLVILGWLIRYVRRQALQPPTEEQGVGFSLKQLERLYRKGELTEAEFKAIQRKQAIQAAQEGGSTGRAAQAAGFSPPTPFNGESPADGPPGKSEKG